MTDDSPSTQASRDSADDIGAIGAMFMLDMDNYVAAASVGYEGLAFYFGGRGGVLGDVPVDDVERGMKAVLGPLLVGLGNRILVGHLSLIHI